MCFSLSRLVVQGYCAKHSKKLDADGTPRKVTSSTPKKHSEMTEEEKKAAKARKWVWRWSGSDSRVDLLRLLSSLCPVTVCAVQLLETVFFSQLF